MGADRVGPELRQRLGRRLQDRPLLQGLGVVGRIGTEQQARRRQFGRQQDQPRLLFERGIVIANPRDLQQVAHDPRMDVGILAQVQGRHVEAKYIDRGDQARQAVVGEHRPMAGDQTVMQHGEVGPELAGPGIGRGCERGRTRRGLSRQDRVSRRQPGVDLTQGPAIGLIGPVRGIVARPLGQGLQSGADFRQRTRQAELGAQRVRRLKIVAHHRLGRRGEGGPQRTRVDIGIAVAVAAHPGADADKGLELRRVQPPTPVDQLLRRDLEEHPLQERNDGVDLVLHHQAGRPHQPRRPQDHRLTTQAVVLDLGRRALVARIQQVRHRRDPVQNALPAHLRRVGRQHRRDQRLGQQGPRLLHRPPRRRQPGQRPFGRIGPRALGRLAARAAPARPVLGDIGQQGEDREPVRQPDRVVERQLVQQPLQLRRALGPRVSVIGDGGHPNGLDPVVEILTAFVPDHLSEQTAEQPHLLAQAVVSSGFGGYGHGHLVQRGGCEARPYQRFSDRSLQRATLKPDVRCGFLIPLADFVRRDSTNRLISLISRRFRRN